jgi:hypothetical protein
MAEDAGVKKSLAGDGLIGRVKCHLSQGGAAKPHKKQRKY